jgi:hypothetical protein
MTGLALADLGGVDLADGLAADFVVESDRAQLNAIVQRLR